MDGDRSTLGFASDSSGLTRALPDLLTDIHAGAALPFERSATLPPEAYVSQAVYDLEVHRIFRRDWICVGHVAQLPNDGDYFTYDLVGEMLVVTRSGGEIRAMSRMCTHRWAPLVSGTGNARLFSCPFHKWAFALDGRLLGAPLMDGVEFDTKDCALPQFRCEIANGFIFLSFSPDTPSLKESAGDMIAELDKYRLEELVVAGSLSYDTKINWKIVVETFMECYHHIAAHSSTFEKEFPARLTYVEDGRPLWTSCHAPVRPELPQATFAGFPELEGVGAAERGEFRLIGLYPLHLLNIFPDRVYWFTVQPLAPGHSIMNTHLLVRPEALENREAVQAQMDFMHVANLEDIAVNEMQQLGAATPSARPGRISHLEKAVWQLAQYVRDRLSVA